MIEDKNLQRKIKKEITSYLNGYDSVTGDLSDWNIKFNWETNKLGL